MAFKTMNPVAISFDNLWETTSEPEIEEKFSTFEDLIAISCVMYRLMQATEDDTGRRFFSLEHDAAKLAKSINQEDRLMAQSIRRYYNGKLTLLRLRGQQFTKFRQDMASLLAVENINGSYTYLKKYLGMVYKLPYFYEYDQNLNEVFGSEYFDLAGKTYFKGTSTLSFVKKLDAFRKRSPVIEYWFTDENDDRVVVHIQKANPLVSVLDHVLTDGELTVTGKFKATRKDTLNYYTLESWQAEFN